MTEERAYLLWQAVFCSEATEEEKSLMMGEMFGWDQDLFGVLLCLQDGKPLPPQKEPSFEVSKQVFQRFMKRKEDERNGLHKAEDAG